MKLIRDLMRWARITKPGKDDAAFAEQQMEYLGKTANGFIIFPYGLHGNVPADALALMFSVEGNPDNRAAIAWTPNDRPRLAAGEVAFYHPPTDATMIWRTTGDLDIVTGNSGTAKINITAASLNITGDVNITGNTAFTGTVTANGKVIDDTHGHIQGSDSNGDSEAPISGVT